MADEKSDDSEHAGVSKWLGWGAKLMRWTGPPGKWVLRELKTRAIFNQSKEFHRVLHCLRKIPHMRNGANANSKIFAIPPSLAVEICTSFRSLMANILELGEQELHCCLKMMVQQDGGDRVGTIGRSDPFDHRPQETSEEESHLVANNTVWCSLLGRPDESHQWQVFSCFSCNDLQAHPLEFKCDRKDWQRFYRSALVFPLRYIHNENNSHFVTVGFLAFDSPKPKVFGQVPDIFKYKDAWHQYHQKLNKTTAFHLGAILADTLSVLMRRDFDEDGKNGELNEQP